MTDTPPLRITLAQTNPTVGDLHGNAAMLIDIINAYAENCDLVVFPELALSGYQPEDLVQHPSFIKHVKTQIDKVAAAAPQNIDVIFGAPWADHDYSLVFNAAIHISGNKIKSVIRKQHLPNYGVFDEKRVFEKNNTKQIIEVNKYKIGLAICEDFWFPDVASDLENQGAKLLISLNGSPFETGKQKIRETLMQARVHETGLPLIYLNLVGGQDDLVYDGNSFILDKDGQKIIQLSSFKNEIKKVEYPFKLKSEVNVVPDYYQDIYDALCLGLKDYVFKNGFKGVILGLSGGIDSALSAVIACEALGSQNVHCVMMPSPYTSQESLVDAQSLAKNLGCPYKIIPIEPAMNAYDQILDNPTGITAENIQSRARGMVLMALSNQTGHMVLTTGNKSEMAVGYATIYGDMCGGFNCLKDVYKTEVYALSRWINREHEIIPDNIITRPPSAELRPDQTDQDSLPSYDILDDILRCLIEKRMGINEMIAEGFEADTVQLVRTLLDRNEYKRRQSAPGVKITAMAFGRDRRMPITNKFRD